MFEHFFATKGQHSLGAFRGMKRDDVRKVLLAFHNSGYFKQMDHFQCVDGGFTYEVSEYIHTKENTLRFVFKGQTLTKIFSD